MLSHYTRHERRHAAAFLGFIVLMFVLAGCALFGSGCGQQQPTPQQIAIGALVAEQAVLSYKGKAPTPEFLAYLRALGPDGVAAADIIEATWRIYQASTRPSN